MKKFLVIAAGILLFTSPAMALFTNGGFETGDFTGWFIDFGTADDSPTGPSVTWGAVDHKLYAVINSDGTMPGQDLDVDPYNGTYMARINDSYGNYHATRISQADTITQQDINDGATIFVNWGAMLVEPTNDVPHDKTQPFFGIEVAVDGDVKAKFAADARAGSAPGSDWVRAGISPTVNSGDLWYKQDTWSFDISNYNIGDEVIISMFVADCGLGGHGGYAFLDGIGTTDPSEPVPEPATILLLGSGLVGLAGFGRKRILKKS